MASPHCATCPAHLVRDSVEQEEIYGKGLGVDTCARTSNLLSSATMSNGQVNQLKIDTAKGCAHYGKPMSSSTKTYIGLHIGVRAAPISVPETAKPEDKGTVKTCRSCMFYIPAMKMQEEIGVRIGLCAQFGRLIPETKTTETAKACGASVRYQPTPTDSNERWADMLGDLVIDPRLGKYLSIGDAVGANIIPEAAPIIEPTTYVSDLPVTPKQQADGIRAWRKLERDGREVFIPVFDVEHFTEAERAKIPRTGDDEHPEQYLDHLDLSFITAVLWRELDETPALHGVAGTGKTEFFRYMAWMMCLPFERISITSSTELDDLAGKTLFEDGETTFSQGRIPKAWTKPCVIVLDEPNVGSPAVWQFIRPLTDNSKQLVLDMNKGETILRNDHAYMGMAMNPAWDVRNVGAETISDADGSRLMHIFVDLPPEDMEKQIIAERCKIDGYDIKPELLGKIMQIASDLRQMSDDQTLPITWGIRNQIKVARATKWFDLRRAYQLASADYLEPSVSETILDTVKNHA